MKNRLPLSTMALSLALWGASQLAHAQATGSVTIYGVADAGVEGARAGKGNTVRLISGGLNGSRLGFRGNEDLGGGLSAVFRLEQGLLLDDGALGQGGRGFGREASVGLQSTSWGTLTLGRLPTPYFVVQSSVDAFNWMGSGGLTAITRSATASRQLLPHVINARQDNAVGWVLPRWSGVEVRALLSAGEGSTALGRGHSLSARYGTADVEAVFAWISQKGAGNANGKADATVAGGSVKLGNARVFAGYTNEKNTCTTCTGALARVAGLTATGASEFTLTNLGARWAVGTFTGIVQVVRVADNSSYATKVGDRDVTWVAVGGEYLLSRRTVIYSSLASVGNRNGSQYALGSGTAQQPAGYVATGDPRASGFTLGVRHSF